MQDLEHHHDSNRRIIYPFFQTPLGTPQIARHVFTTKLTARQQRYNDLDCFRQQIEESKAGVHHQPYSSKKRKVLAYKLIFYGFALLFFILTMASLSLPTAISCGLLFQSCTFAKGAVIGLSVVLSLTSLAVALAMQTEREAVCSSIRKAQARMATLYSRKRVTLGILHALVLFGAQRKQAAALRQLYLDSLEKINDKKDEVLHLVNRIVTAETMENCEKEALLNQAIEELNEQLQLLTQNFKHSTLPHFAD